MHMHINGNDSLASSKESWKAGNVASLHGRDQAKYLAEKYNLPKIEATAKVDTNRYA